MPRAPYVLTSPLIPQDGAVDGCNRDRRSNAYKDYGQHGVSVAAVIIDLVYIRIADRRGRVRLAVANDEVFIADTVNVAFHFCVIVQSDGHFGLRADAELGDVLL